MDDKTKAGESADGKNEERRRGRPRKVVDTAEEKQGMKIFLQKAMTSEKGFEKRDKILRSPIRKEEDSKVDKENEGDSIEENSKEEENKDMESDKEEQEEVKLTQERDEVENREDNVEASEEERWEKIERKMKRMGLELNKLREENVNLENRFRELKEEGERRARKQETEINELKGKVQVLMIRSEEKKTRVEEEKKGPEVEMENVEDIGNHSTGSESEEDDPGEKNNEGVRIAEIDMTNREYIKEIPKALEEQEIEWELKERKNRKKNIMVRGLRTVGKNLENEVKDVIKSYLEIEIYISQVRAIGGGLLVELESFKNKLEVMKRKQMLKGKEIWIEDDLTQREKEVQRWLEKIKESETTNRLEARTEYMKIKVQGEWYYWNEKKGQLKKEKELFQKKRSSGGETRGEEN